MRLRIDMARAGRTLGLGPWLLAMVTACSGSPTDPSTLLPTPLTLSLAIGQWQTIGDPNPFPLANDGAAHLVFEFPNAGSMHYLYTPSQIAALRGTVVVSLRVMTSGSVVFNSLDPVTSSCTIPVSVRPFFWANGTGNGDFDRWWSNPQSFPLAAGSATISVPLSPEYWSSVNGQFGDADSFTRFGFAKAILNVTQLGVTFGGGCSFGHGINVTSGSAQFQLTGYAIQ